MAAGDDCVIFAKQEDVDSLICEFNKISTDDKMKPEHGLG